MNPKWLGVRGFEPETIDSGVENPTNGATKWAGQQTFFTNWESVDDKIVCNLSLSLFYSAKANGYFIS